MRFDSGRTAFLYLISIVQVFAQCLKARLDPSVSLSLRSGTWTDTSKALGDSSPLGISTLFKSLGGWGTVRLFTISFEARRADSCCATSGPGML